MMCSPSVLMLLWFCHGNLLGVVIGQSLAESAEQADRVQTDVELGITLI